MGNRHEVAEQRSIEYHRAVALRLRSEPSILERARDRVRGALLDQPAPPPHVQRWSEILARELDEIAAFLVDPSELARELRQSSPFAGALSPRERWAIWRRSGS